MIEHFYVDQNQKSCAPQLTHMNGMAPSSTVGGNAEGPDPNSDPSMNHLMQNVAGRYVLPARKHHNRQPRWVCMAEGEDGSTQVKDKKKEDFSGEKF